MEIVSAIMFKNENCLAVIFKNENCLAIIFENCPDPLTSPNVPSPNCMYFTRFSATQATILATILATIFINGRYIGDYFSK